MLQHPTTGFHHSQITSQSFICSARVYSTLHTLRGCLQARCLSSVTLHFVLSVCTWLENVLNCVLLLRFLIWLLVLCSPLWLSAHCCVTQREDMQMLCSNSSEQRLFWCLLQHSCFWLRAGSTACSLYAQKKKGGVAKWDSIKNRWSPAHCTTKTTWSSLKMATSRLTAPN